MKKNNPLIIRFILFALLGILVSACGKGETRVEQGNREGILHFGNYGEPSTIDPHTASGVPEHHIIDSLFEGLVSKNPKDLSIIPAVAKSWQISQDGLFYDFYLRDNAKWSNGDPVTAHDFVWSWWRALQPKLGNRYVYSYFPIKNAQAFFQGKIKDFKQVGVTAINDKHLRIQLEKNTPYFLELLTFYPMYPVHRATVEKFDGVDRAYARWTRPENLVSNGAFILKSWRLNKSIRVEKNPLYWDTVKLNGIVFYPVDNLSVEERMFRAGQLHRTENVPLDKVPEYRKNNPTALHIYPYSGTYFYRFNTKHKPLDDIRVRKALAMSIDRESLIKNVLLSLFQPAYSLIPVGMNGYQPLASFKYDIQTARQLLSEAGYPNGQGFPTLELQYNTHEQHRKIAIAIQQMWKKTLNINITLANKDWKVYQDDEVSGNFNISRGGWIADYLDPYTFMDMWFKSSGNNRTGWSSEQFEELIINKTTSTLDKQKRFAYFQQAEKLFLDDLPIIPIYFYSNRHLIDPSVQGMPTNILAKHNFKQIWLKQDSNQHEASK